jgi:hypothetical protein
MVPVRSKNWNVLKDKERMVVRFDEENTSGAPVSRDGESAASAAE